MPPNDWYGFRTEKTLSNPNIWYKANYFSGWCFVIASLIAVILIVLPMVSPNLFSLVGNFKYYNIAVFLSSLIIAAIVSAEFISKL